MYQLVYLSSTVLQLGCLSFNWSICLQLSENLHGTLPYAGRVCAIVLDPGKLWCEYSTGPMHQRLPAIVVPVFYRTCGAIVLDPGKTRRYMQACYA